MATLSFHAGTEGKMSKQNMKGLLNHTLRKTLDKYKNHGNDKIRPEHTKDNVDWTKDNRPVDELVDERLEMEYKGKKKLRSDAVVLREIIIQPSAEIFVGMSEAEKQQKAIQFTNDSLKWFGDEFGEENIMAASLHMDETNPHAHVMVMPMTRDGKLAQKEFFKGPADLKRQHREYRTHMNALGWDFDQENKYENVDGVPLPHYKANAKELELKRIEQRDIIEELKSDRDVRQEAQDAVYSDIYDSTLSDEREALNDRERALNEREKALNERERQVEAKEQEQKAREEELFNRMMDVSGREHDVSMKERRIGHYNKSATAVALAVLDGDIKRKTFYDKLEQKGVIGFDPDGVHKVLVGSLEDASKGRRRLSGASKVHKEIARMEVENDGPEL